MSENITYLYDITPQMRLYGLSVTDTDYFDAEGLSNILEDGICSGIYGKFYIDVNEIIPIEYIGDFAGKSDVIREISKNGESTFYTIEEMKDCPGIIQILEASIHKKEIFWEISEYDGVDDLSYVYKAFRDRGIFLKNDMYGKRDEINQIHMERALFQKQLLEERERLLKEKFKFFPNIEPFISNIAKVLHLK